VIGNCGFSSFPLSDRTREMTRHFARPVLGHAGVAWDWRDLDGYFDRLAVAGTAVNVAALIGHGTLRSAVMGFDKRAPTKQELTAMQGLLELAMKQGAFGLSTGLCYAPGVFAGTAEIVELCRVVADNGGLYATHLRDQSDRLEEAVAEALGIGTAASVPVLISHHKAAGQRNWGKVKSTLAMLDKAQAAGVKTWSDVYPYIAGQSTMVSILPPWVMEGGPEQMLRRLVDPQLRARISHDFETGLSGWENRAGALGWDKVIISAVATQKNKDIEGLSVSAAAQRRDKSPVPFLLDLLLDEQGSVGRVSIQCCEEDVATVLAHERTMIGSDGLDVENPHPRQYGCFARVLGEYVRARKTLPLELAIYKMTGLPAATFGLHDLGRLQPGLRADLVIFDPVTVRDVATFADPCRHPEGIRDVFVGGIAAVANELPTGARNGRVLRNKPH
jgi:N-acyl-D-aspartate/D-glutamate deacylase